MHYTLATTTTTSTISTTSITATTTTLQHACAVRHVKSKNVVRLVVRMLSAI